MRLPATKPATYADLEALPANQVGELIRGVVYASPRPAMRHALVSSALGSELGGPFQRGRGGPGGWWILDEPELHLGDDVLVPDLAGWRRERLPEIPDVTGCAVVPNWACEILSPSTATLDVRDKLPLYLRRGVEHVWVIDPVHKLVEVFVRAGDLPQLLQSASGEELARLSPFDAFELDLAALWGK